MFTIENVTSLKVTSRILYVRIWHLFAHWRTILNKMAWTVGNFYWPSASEHGQSITNTTMIWKPTMPLIDMYIRKIFWLTAPSMSRMPRKRDNQQIGDRVGLFSVRFLTPLCLNPSTVCWIQMSHYLHQVTATGDETSFAVVCAAFRCLFYRLA